MRVPTVDQTNLRRRAAQFGWLTVGLAALAIGLLVVAAVLLTTQGREVQLRAVLLPLNLEFGNPGARCWPHRPFWWLPASSAWPRCRPRR